MTYVESDVLSCWSGIDHTDSHTTYCRDHDIFTEEITLVSNDVAWLGKACHSGVLVTPVR